MYLKSLVGDVYNGTNTEENTTRTENVIKDIYWLQAPVVYNLEDLVMSLTLLLVLFFMILLWFGFAWCMIYLAYNKREKSIQYLDEIEEDLSST